MELRHLRYFIALAERLNFTQAAALVHVTQSTLSHQIGQLEEELGQRLFDRSERRVTITAAGELFLSKALKGLAEIDSGIASMNTLQKNLAGELRIGTTPTLNLRVVPQCIALFAQDHPSIHVMVDENTGDGLVADLRTGRLDVAIAYQPFALDELLFEPLYTEEMVLVVSAQHPFARRRRVRMVELHRREMVLPPRKFTTRVQIDEAFKAAGAEPFVAIEIVSIAAMLALVQQTALATIVARSAWAGRAGLLEIPLEAPTLVRTPGLIWIRDQPRAPAVAAFASIVRGVAKSVQREGGGSSRAKPARTPQARAPTQRI